MLYQEQLLRLARRFNQHHIPYAVIGGQAVLLHGEIRQTRDIDITLGLDIDSLDKILAISEEANLFPASKNFREDVNKTLTLILIDEVTHLRFDLLFSWSDFEKKIVEQVIKVKVEGEEVNFISRENLLVMKLFSGREIDKIDARGIILKNKDIDIDEVKKKLEYLQSFIEKNLIADLEKILAEIKS